MKTAVEMFDNEEVDLLLRLALCLLEFPDDFDKIAGELELSQYEKEILFHIWDTRSGVALHKLAQEAHV